MQSTNSENGSSYLATHHFTFTKLVYVRLLQIILLLLSEWETIQGKFCLKVKTKGCISNHCSWSSCTSRRSKSPTLYIFMIICKSPLLFHRREERGEQSSLACKEKCTETSRCVLLHAHRDQFQDYPKESNQLVKNGHPVSPLKYSHLKIRLKSG